MTQMLHSSGPPQHSTGPSPASGPSAASRPGGLAVVFTGGTVASQVSAGTGAERDGRAGRLVVMSSEDDSADAVLVRRLLADRHVDLAGVTFVSPLRRLSENMGPADWATMASAVRALHDAGAGRILVLHGTDTAAYSAAALSFALADLPVTVVLTGANLPPGEPGSDAARNIADAVTALDRLAPGVFLSFAGDPAGPSSVHLGTAVRKVRASGQAFYSINRPVVAEVGDAYREVSAVPDRTPLARAVHGDVRFDERVMLLRLHPGIDLRMAAEAAAAHGIAGVVVELYPSGTGPQMGGGPGALSLGDFVRACREHGAVVVATVANAPAGPRNHYESTVALEEAGALFTRDMLPETALVKLMWLLGHYKADEARDLVLAPCVAGELTDPGAVAAGGWA